MAGQTETLSFTEPEIDFLVPVISELDDISFSPMAVTPEPEPLVLMGIGGVVFALYRRFGPARQ